MDLPFQPKGDTDRLEGVLYGSSGPPANTPKIVLGDAGGGDKLTALHVQDAVVREANKEDNRTKLAASGATERHIFVVIDSKTDYTAWAAMRSCPLPIAPPQLPQEITTAWIVADLEFTGGFRVWRVTPPKAWEDLGLVQVSL